MLVAIYPLEAKLGPAVVVVLDGFAVFTTSGCSTCAVQPPLLVYGGAEGLYPINRSLRNARIAEGASAVGSLFKALSKAPGCDNYATNSSIDVS